MKKVGILVGREVTFPESIINSINEKGGGEVVAEMVTIGGITLDEPKRYDVIIDRISHESTVLPCCPKAFCARRHVYHQQPVLVVGGRQVLQLRLGRKARRRDPEDGPSAAAQLHQGHHAREPPQSRISDRLARLSSIMSDFRRSSNRSTAAAGRTSRRSTTSKNFSTNTINPARSA